jgi:hypothetical protein
MKDMKLMLRNGQNAPKRDIIEHSYIIEVKALFNLKTTMKSL